MGRTDKSEIIGAGQFDFKDTTPPGMKSKQLHENPFCKTAFSRFRAIAGYLIFASLYGLELPSATAQDIIGVIIPAKSRPAEDIPADMILQSGHFGRVTGLVFSSDGDMLASAGDDRTIQLWNVAEGRQILCLRGHTGAVRAIAFSPDQSRLASGSDDHTISGLGGADRQDRCHPANGKRIGCSSRFQSRWNPGGWGRWRAV